MCVLTYLPLSEGGFILTHNRDEHVARQRALEPRQYSHGGVAVVYPKDPKGGGTWIASSERFSLCLLNGAFENHTPSPPYRQSRGLVILDFFDYQDFGLFVEEYRFEGIEPFTLVVADAARQQLWELRWDAERLHHSPKDYTSAHIWSSATLYTPEVRRAREAWFAEWLRQSAHYSPAGILDFHLHGGTGDTHNDMRMNRSGQLLTQSVTQIHRPDTQTYRLMYQDLLLEQERHYCVL